jgi:hypothetical protein
LNIESKLKVLEEKTLINPMKCKKKSVCSSKFVVIILRN